MRRRPRCEQQEICGWTHAESFRKGRDKDRDRRRSLVASTNQGDTEVHTTGTQQAHWVGVQFPREKRKRVKQNGTGKKAKKAASHYKQIFLDTMTALAHADSLTSNVEKKKMFHESIGQLSRGVVVLGLIKLLEDRHQWASVARRLEGRSSTTSGEAYAVEPLPNAVVGKEHHRLEGVGRRRCHGCWSRAPT